VGLGRRFSACFGVILSSNVRTARKFARNALDFGSSGARARNQETVKQITVVVAKKRAKRGTLH